VLLPLISRNSRLILLIFGATVSAFGSA